MSFFVKITLYLLPTLLFCENIGQINVEKKANKRSKIRCRIVCDKKAYKEEEIAKAISFYKNSKYYKFELQKKEKF